MSRSTSCPASNDSIVTLAPKFLAISPNRSPKFPILAQSTLSPGESVFVIAASSAPVPDAVSIYISLDVQNIFLRFSVFL